MSIQRKNTLAILIIVVIIAAISLGGLIYRGKNHQPAESQVVLNIDGTVLPNTRLIHPFKFTDTHEKVFTNANLQNHWTLLFFGFTNCGYVCPTTLAELGKMYDNLKGELPAELMPQVVMVSVDPERDTTARMTDYLKSFNAAFIGIRASIPETNALANQMSVVFAKVQMPNGDYTINHSAEIMLLDPNGNLRAFLSYPHKADQMMKDYITIVRAYPLAK